MCTLLFKLKTGKKKQYKQKTLLKSYKIQITILKNTGLAYLCCEQPSPWGQGGRDAASVGNHVVE